MENIVMVKECYNPKLNRKAVDNSWNGYFHASEQYDRRKYYDTVQKDLLFLKKKRWLRNLKAFVIHPPRGASFNVAVEMLSSIAEKIGRDRLLIENVTKKFPGGDVLDLISLAEEIGCGLCVDLGHTFLLEIRTRLNSFGGKEAIKKGWSATLSKTDEAVRAGCRYFHIHSPVWLRDRHRTPGTNKALITEPMFKEWLERVPAESVFIDECFDEDFIH